MFRCFATFACRDTLKGSVQPAAFALRQLQFYEVKMDELLCSKIPPEMQYERTINSQNCAYDVPSCLSCVKVNESRALMNS